MQIAQATKIASMISIDEQATRKDGNQISTLKWAGDNNWGSHFYSICNLNRMYDATCSNHQNIEKDGSTYSQRGDASVSLKMIQLFEFIFILHLMKRDHGHY